MDEFWLRDWRMFMAAIRHWHAGGDPYGPFTGFTGVAHHAGAFGYPPPALLLASPLALLPWQLTGVLFVILSAVAFERYVQWASGRSGLVWLLLWLPLAQGLMLGQTTTLALVGLLFAERYYREGRDRQAALLLSLALLKPQATILAGAWLLLVAIRERRWRFPLTVVGINAALWAASFAIAGPQILPWWINGLIVYDDLLPDRMLLLPPYGPLIGLLTIMLWWRNGRGDVFGLLMLLNTLIYPLSVVYMTAAVAFAVIRWRRDWVWYPLGLSWAIVIFFPPEVRSHDSIAAMVQSVTLCGFLAGLLPPMLRLRAPARAREPGAPTEG